MSHIQQHLQLYDVNYVQTEYYAVMYTRLEIVLENDEITAVFLQFDWYEYDEIQLYELPLQAAVNVLHTEVVKQNKK